MQAASGVEQQPLTPQSTPYFMGSPCDPNLLAFASHGIFGYPPKSMYQHVLPQQMSSYLLPQALHQPLTASHASMLPQLSAIPDMDKAALEEPIEAGSLSYRRPKSTTLSDDLSRSTYMRRHSATWETMTDDERELIQRQKRKEEAFKTALCDAYKRSGHCPYGEDCRFAHGENELRMPSQPRGKAHPKYKTQLCDKFSSLGTCPYGPRCQFIHKLKKGLPLLEYNRALIQGQISPARDDEIINPDESDDQSINLTRLNLRRRSANDMSDSGYGGGRNGGSGSRRNLANHVDHDEEPRNQKSSRPIYPPMQVVNIEMATGQKKSHQRRSLPSMINQADYEASMANGKIFGKPENIRTYGAMVRASEEHVDRSNNKKERGMNAPVRKELSLIREEDTVIDGSQLHSSTSAPQMTNKINQQIQPQTNNLPWYQKIFGTKMTVIDEESADDSLPEAQQRDMPTNAGVFEKKIIGKD